MSGAPDIDGDEQDQSEVFDETNMTENGEDIVNFDEMPDVLDVTSADGDADDDEFDEDEVDDDDLEDDDELRYRAVNADDEDEPGQDEARAGDSSDYAATRRGAVDPVDIMADPASADSPSDDE
jgi:hypothetical protein